MNGFIVVFAERKIVLKPLGLVTRMRSSEEQKIRITNEAFGKYHLSIFLLLLSSLFCFSQSNKTDSLLTALKTTKEDTNKVKTLNVLGWEYKYSNPDTSYIILKQALALARKIKWQKGEAVSLRNIGGYHLDKGDYPQALNFYMSSFKISENIQDKPYMAKILGNIGIVYMSQADYPKALDYYFKALKMDEELGNSPYEATAKSGKNGIARHLGNIGTVYFEQADYPKALDYFFKALKINEELGGKREIAMTLGNIGNIYKMQTDYAKALDHYFKALKIDEELGNKNGIARHLGNIGHVYSAQADASTSLSIREELFNKTLDYYLKALKTFEEFGAKKDIALALLNIGLHHAKTGKFAEAEKCFKHSLTICDSLGILDITKQVEKSLSDLYDTTGRHKLALEHYKKYITVRDSIINQENTKLQVQKEMQYQFDKQQAADSIKTAERATQEKQKHEQEIQQQIIYTYGGLIGFLLMIVVAGVSFRAYKSKQKANEIITAQKKLVDEKQKEILDSIHYARRIQRSLLPTENYLAKNLDKFKD